MAGGGDKQAGVVVGAIGARDAIFHVVGIAVFHADVPAVGAEIFGGFAFLACGRAAVLALSIESEVFTAIEACASCDGGVFGHVGKEFACAVGASGFGCTTDAVVAGFSIWAGCAVVDLSVAVVVDAVADLGASCPGFGGTFGALAVCATDFLSVLFTSAFADFAGLAEIGKGFIGFSVAVVVFSVAGLSGGFAVFVLATVVFASVVVGTGFWCEPNDAAVLVASAGFKAFAVACASFVSEGTLSGFATFGDTFVALAFVGAGATFHGVAPCGAVVFVENTFVVFSGCFFGASRAACVSWEANRRACAFVAVFPPFAKAPQKVCAAFLDTFLTDGIFLAFGDASACGSKAAGGTATIGATGGFFGEACAIFVIDTFEATAFSCATLSCWAVCVAPAHTAIFKAFFR